MGKQKTSMQIRKISLLLSSIITFVTAAGHALLGQAHLSRILETSTEKIDSAVMFAVWHMVTIILISCAIGFLLLVACKQAEIARKFSLVLAVIFCLFGLIFISTQILYGEPTIQWIAMLLISLFSFIGYRYTDKAIDL